MAHFMVGGIWFATNVTALSQEMINMYIIAPHEIEVHSISPVSGNAVFTLIYGIDPFKLTPSHRIDGFGLQRLRDARRFQATAH